MGGVLGDASVGDREADQLVGAPVEAHQAHDHPQEQRQEVAPPCLAGARLLVPYCHCSLQYCLGSWSFRACIRLHARSRIARTHQELYSVHNVFPTVVYDSGIWGS